MTGPQQPDPFVASLEKELGDHGIALPDMDPDMKFLCAMGRSLRRREQEVADIKAWTTARVRTLTNEVNSIKSWKMGEAMRCVDRLLRGKKSKSIKVPGYQFGRRTAKAAVGWDSEYLDDVVKWAKEFCPSAISYPEPTPPPPKIDKDMLVQWAVTNRRAPKWCTYESAGDVAYARPVKGDEDE